MLKVNPGLHLSGQIQVFDFFGTSDDLMQIVVVAVCVVVDIVPMDLFCTVT